MSERKTSRHSLRFELRIGSTPFLRCTYWAREIQVVYLPKCVCVPPPKPNISGLLILREPQDPTHH